MRWVPIPGWETRYEISESGSVRSKEMRVRARGNTTATRKGRMLTPVRKSNGYLCVTLSNGVDRPQIGLHRLVARAFLGECPVGLHVLHCDGDKENNHYTNLRYGTPAENVADTARHGRQKKRAAHPCAKLDEDAVLVIRTSGRSAKEVASWFNVSVGHIYAIRRERVWR